MAGVFGGLGIVLWWLFFSRAPWSERLGALALMVAGARRDLPLVDKSIAKGAMGMLFSVLSIPVLTSPSSPGPSPPGASRTGPGA